jgi:hypothetical protein
MNAYSKDLRPKVLGAILVEATGRALDAIIPEDLSGFYADCGYRHPCS